MCNPSLIWFSPFVGLPSESYDKLTSPIPQQPVFTSPDSSYWSFVAPMKASTDGLLIFKFLLNLHATIYICEKGHMFRIQLALASNFIIIKLLKYFVYRLYSYPSIVFKVNSIYIKCPRITVNACLFYTTIVSPDFLFSKLHYVHGFLMKLLCASHFHNGPHNELFT